MLTVEKDSDRRLNERLNLSLQIFLPTHNGKTVNVSSSGVYFEVSTNDMDAFSPGTIIPLQITALANTPGFQEKKLKLIGNGRVIRNCIIETTDHDKRVGVALEFKDKLNIVVGKDHNKF